MCVRRKIADLLPPKTFVENPVDMGFAWMPPIFTEVAKALLLDPNVDTVIMYGMAAAGAMVEMLRSMALEALSVREPGKLLLLGTDISSYDILADLVRIQQAGVPVYLAPDRAVRSLVQKVRYERIRRHFLRQAPPPRAGKSE